MRTHLFVGSFVTFGLLISIQHIFGGQTTGVEFAKPLMIADFENESVLSLMVTTPGVSVSLSDQDVVSGKQSLEVQVRPYSIHKNRWPYIAFGSAYFPSPIDCSCYSKIQANIRNVTKGQAGVRLSFSTLPYNDGGRNLEGETFFIPGKRSMLCELSVSRFKRNDPSSLRFMAIVFPANETEAVYRIDAIQAVYNPLDSSPAEHLEKQAASVNAQLSAIRKKMDWKAVPNELRQTLQVRIPKLAADVNQIMKSCRQARVKGFGGTYRAAKEKLDSIAHELGQFVIADKKGFYLWEINPYIYIHRDEFPHLSSPELTRIDVAMALGEYRDKCFMVSACEKDIQLDVEIKPQKSFPTNAVQIRECLYYHYGGEDVGDVLYKLGGPLTVPKGEARQVWLTFDSRNSGMKPGSYPFTLVLRERGGQIERRIPGTLTVWDFQLPSWDDIPNNAYVEFHNSEVGAKVLAEAVEHMKMYGVNMVYVYPHLMPWPVEVDEELNIVKFDTTRLEEQVRPALRAWKAAPGNERLRFVFALTDAPNRLLADKEILYPSEEWKKIFAQWFRHLKKILRAWGLPDEDWIVVLGDEANESALLTYELPLAEVIKSINPSIKIACNTSTVINDDAASKRFFKAFDFFRPNLDTIERNPYLLDWLKQSGKPIWSYRCEVTMGWDKNLYEYYRVYEWKNYKYGITAPGVWTYCAQGESPWGKGQHGVAWCMVFKHKDRNDIVHSRRYEFYREGLDDYRYLLALKKLARARGADAEEQAEKLIQQAIADITSNVRDTGRCEKWRRRIAKEILTELL